MSETDAAIAFYLDCIDELGFTNSTIIIKNDQEPAIKSVIDAVVQQRKAQSIIEESPKGSSQSNGHAESAVQEAEHQVRALRLALESRLGSRVPIEHHIIPWLVLHAGFTHNRFQLGHDGRTPYMRIKHKSYDRSLVEFGECVHYKKTKYEIGPGLYKYDDRWGEGVFLGIRARSNEVYIGTPEGVIKTRTIHRKPLDERWKPQVVQAIRGTPWDLVAPDPPELAAEQQLRPIVDGSQPLLPESPEAASEGEHRYNSFKIFKSDLKEFGYTPNCPGCSAARDDRAQRPHTAQCRTRMQQLLIDNPSSKSRVEAAQNRLKQNNNQQQAQQPQQQHNKQQTEQHRIDDMDEDELFSKENVDKTGRLLIA